MKKLICNLLAMFILILPFNMKAKNETIGDSVTIVSSSTANKLDLLISRVDEIKLMDMSKLSNAEKTELKMELYSIKKELKEHKASATNGITATLLAIIIGAVLGAVLVLLFLVGAFN